MTAHYPQEAHNIDGFGYPDSSNIIVRRSNEDWDAVYLQRLVSRSRFIYEKRFGDAVNSISNVIQNSFLCVTALSVHENAAEDAHESVVGFLALDVGPSRYLQSPIRRDWFPWLKLWYDPKSVRPVAFSPSSTLWISFLCTNFEHEAHAFVEMLRTVLCTLPHITGFLLLLEEGIPPFSPIKELFHEIEIRTPEALDNFKGTLWYMERECIEPDVLVRDGVVQDYDDLVPLLSSNSEQSDEARGLKKKLGGVDTMAKGVITTMHNEMYLDELLERQDEYHAVLIIQDPVSHDIVGVLCLSADVELQHDLVQTYLLDGYSGLRKLRPPSTDSLLKETDSRDTTLNTVWIDFLFIHPSYESRAAASFLPHIYKRFPFAEYCAIHLPHDLTEPCFLHDFSHVPTRSFTPMSDTGEPILAPPGLWIASRYTTESPLSVNFTDDTMESALQKLLRCQQELSDDYIEDFLREVQATSESQIGHTLNDGEEAPGDTTARDSQNSFVLLWEGNGGVPPEIVGTCVTRTLSESDLHALRTNFDVDKFSKPSPGRRDDNSLIVAPYAAIDLIRGENELLEMYHSTDQRALVVEQFYVHPIFRCRIRFFLAEILRFTRSHLVFTLTTPGMETFTPLLQQMILTPPRHVRENSSAVLAQQDASHHEMPHELQLLCLHMQTPKGLSDEKIRIHARIVVIGASTTGLSFLWNLINIPYVVFTNLVLITRDGLPEHPNEWEYPWYVDTMEWLEREYMMLRIGNKLRVLEATLIDFDRLERYVIPDTGMCVPYDHLILTTGREYKLLKSITQTTHHGIISLAGIGALQSIMAHVQETEMYDDHESCIVIYGATCEVYAVATALTRLNITPDRIIIAIAPSPEASLSTTTHSLFYDEHICRCMDRLMDTLGIRTYVNYVYHSAEFDDDNNLTRVCMVSAEAHFNAQKNTQQQENGCAVLPKFQHTSPGSIVEFSASLMICMDEKDIDRHILSSLNKRSIVFDGRVIVERNFRTTDPNIYAAGPVAMLSRRYGHSLRAFESYSSREVGRHLAEVILGFLNIEEFTDSVEPIDMENRAEYSPGRKVLEYKSVLTQRIHLNDSFQLFQCHTIDYSKIAERCFPISSTDESGECYLCIAVTPDRYIACVSYFGKESLVDVHRLKALVGIPESHIGLLHSYYKEKKKLDAANLEEDVPKDISETRTLNTVEEEKVRSAEGISNSRLQEKKKREVLNLFEFLQQEWMAAVFYDRYSGMFDNLVEEIFSDRKIQKLTEDMANRMVRSDLEHMENKDRDTIRRTITSESSELSHKIELSALRYLHENKAYLPPLLYYLPDISAYLQKEFD